VNRLIAAVVAAVVCVAAFAGTASATPPTPASGVIWNPNQHVSFRWKEGDEPPTWIRPAVNAAAQDSNDSRASRAAILAQADDGDSWIAYTGDIPTTYAIGYTIRYIPSFFTMRLRPQAYPLDWGTLRWCQFYDSPPIGCYDAETIALHELGHAQTLDHPDDADVTDWTDTVMHWAPKTKAKAGWNQHEFGRCDVARLQIRYQPLNSSTAISTCVDLATNLSLNSSSSSATYASTVTLTSRLSIADDAIWPNLASDPLAGRQVTLQRRAVGASSWSNVGTMAVVDDNGRYSKTFAALDTFDYRAVFTGPANEGIESSTSPIVRVTVSSGGGDCSYTKSTIRRSGEFYTC
jgi:hypothetical protein